MWRATSDIPQRELQRGNREANYHTHACLHFMAGHLDTISARWHEPQLLASLPMCRQEDCSRSAPMTPVVPDGNNEVNICESVIWLLPSLMLAPQLDASRFSAALIVSIPFEHLCAQLLPMTVP